MNGESEPEFDPEELSEAISEAMSTGARKLCIRARRCVRAISCESAQDRGVTCDLQDLFKGKATDFNDCSSWTPRKELASTGDVPRRRAGSGSKHNAHADRQAAQRELLRRINAGEPIPNSPYTPAELKTQLEASLKRKLEKKP